MIRSETGRDADGWGVGAGKRAAWQRAAFYHFPVLFLCCCPRRTPTAGCVLCRDVPLLPPLTPTSALGCQGTARSPIVLPQNLVLLSYSPCRGDAGGMEDAGCRLQDAGCRRISYSPSTPSTGHAEDVGLRCGTLTLKP
jgi:hypothetical protein